MIDNNSPILIHSLTFAYAVSEIGVKASYDPNTSQLTFQVIKSVYGQNFPGSEKSKP